MVRREPGTEAEARPSSPQAFGTVEFKQNIELSSEVFGDLDWLIQIDQLKNA